jgi:VIT1/CCC1 family predicted Fe2+/Mn2+ transporter
LYRPCGRRSYFFFLAAAFFFGAAFFLVAFFIGDSPIEICDLKKIAA